MAEKDGAVGVTALLLKGRIVLVSDTLVHEWPDEYDLARIAARAAATARSLGLEPRVAFVSFSTFGYPVSERAEKMAMAPEVLQHRGVDFEFDGEMTVDVALNPDVLAQYPFCKLSGPANILVVPARHSASISVKLMQPHSQRDRSAGSAVQHNFNCQRHSEHGGDVGLSCGLGRAG